MGTRGHAWPMMDQWYDQLYWPTTRARAMCTYHTYSRVVCDASREPDHAFRETGLQLGSPSPRPRTPFLFGTSGLTSLRSMRLPPVLPDTILTEIRDFVRSLTNSYSLAELGVFLQWFSASHCFIKSLIIYSYACKMLYYIHYYFFSVLFICYYQSELIYLNKSAYFAIIVDIDKS